MTQSLHSHLFPVGHAILLYVSLPVMCSGLESAPCVDVVFVFGLLFVPV